MERSHWLRLAKIGEWLLLPLDQSPSSALLRPPAASGLAGVCPAHAWTAGRAAAPPWLQVSTSQAPSAHLGVAFSTDEQSVPHAPQLGMASSAVSQPFAALPSQLPNPGKKEGLEGG